MNNFLIESMMSLLIIFLNQPQLLAADKPGEYYSPVAVKYDSVENITYASFARYYVWGTKYGEYGSYNTTGTGGQVRVYQGKLSVAELIKDGEDRADDYITVVSSIK